MKLNRALIKQQAKQLIKDNVLKMFAITLVVMICTTLPMLIFLGIGEGAFFFKTMNSLNTLDDVYDGYDDYYEDYYDDYFDNFTGDGSGSDFFNFGADTIPYDVDPYNNPAEDAFGELVGMLGTMMLLYFMIIIGGVITLLLSPLEISLAGTYVKFIRGQRFDTDAGVKNTFREAFKNRYGKKLGVYFLRNLVTTLLAYCFYIPGIIFGYSSYFAAQLLCDYPELSPWQAIMLSRKIVRGNRMELFILDLSFIPWLLLTALVWPVAIYTLPYINTTVALYYENFRIRAIQEGRVTEDDFLSDRQRYEKYVSARMNNGYYNPQGAPVNNGAQYYNPQPQQPPVENSAPAPEAEAPAGPPAPETAPQEANVPDEPVPEESPKQDTEEVQPDTEE